MSIARQSKSRENELLILSMDHSESSCWKILKIVNKQTSCKHANGKTDSVSIHLLVQNESPGLKFPFKC